MTDSISKVLITSQVRRLWTLDASHSSNRIQVDPQTLWTHWPIRTSALATSRSTSHAQGIMTLHSLTEIFRFQKLGINTLRVYTIDNSADHDTCMNALADAGIYLALDVNTPKYSIRQDKPAQSYNHVYLQNIFATIDEFSKYKNTLLFFSGNEVINNVPTSVTGPWIKAVTRDMKQYIGNRKYRPIPVGYSAADIDDNRLETAEYMNCGTDDQRVDFFAFNDYSWCDPSDFVTSGWQKKVQAWSDYSVPLL